MEEYTIWLWGGDVEEYLACSRGKMEEYPIWLQGEYTIIGIEVSGMCYYFHDSDNSPHLVILTVAAI